jgi:hypothetical protein
LALAANLVLQVSDFFFETKKNFLVALARQGQRKSSQI